ncbi:hypothetical protein AOC05_01475 [Arthrobacter alpinus]|uniref:Uncharacterized protein n=1 Tax=Arthrobacter alpinus TaxID=656366 RepID=A0A0M4QN87_9MICC|nr:hypothetical protein AOC05_01475 [Arthrobacter alpinus]
MGGAGCGPGRSHLGQPLVGGDHLRVNCEGGVAEDLAASWAAHQQGHRGVDGGVEAGQCCGEIRVPGGDELAPRELVHPPLPQCLKLFAGGAPGRLCKGCEPGGEKPGKSQGACTLE